jgi:hypothetical protein
MKQIANPAPPQVSEADEHLADFVKTFKDPVLAFNEGFKTGLAKGREGMVPVNEVGYGHEEVLKMVAEAVRAERNRISELVKRRIDYALSIKGSDSCALLNGAKFTILAYIQSPDETGDEGMVLNPELKKPG